MTSSRERPVIAARSGEPASSQSSSANHKRPTYSMPSKLTRHETTYRRPECSMPPMYGCEGVSGTDIVTANGSQGPVARERDQAGEAGVDQFYARGVAALSPSPAVTDRNSRIGGKSRDGCSA